MKGGRFIVKEVVPGRAAYKSGRVKPGDEIVAINSLSVKVLSAYLTGCMFSCTFALSYRMTVASHVFS